LPHKHDELCNERDYGEGQGDGRERVDVVDRRDNDHAAREVRAMAAEATARPAGGTFR
jgi:hypothetical protein